MKSKLLLIAALSLILAAIVFGFDPHSIYEESTTGLKVPATIVSIDGAASMVRFNHMEKLSVRLSNGKTVKALGLEKHLIDCSIGDLVAVRKIESERTDSGLYRLVSKSCTRSIW